jgi:seryl-tRNA synthetase
MHDLAFFRANLDSIAQRLATRGYQLTSRSSGRWIPSAARPTESEQLKAQKNAKSAEIGKLRKRAGCTAASRKYVRHRRSHHGSGRKAKAAGRGVS